MFTQYTHELELDLTNLCNARCPQCPRYDINYRLRPGLNKNNLSLELIKTQIDVKYLKMVERFYHIGTTGEPTLNPEFLDIEKFLLDINPTATITCHTNGAMHDEDFWAKCGQIYSTSPDSVVQFGIDGLETTNHIYRRKVSWNKLQENANAFIQAGGYAVWDFIVFEHNQHEVESARQMSIDLGFKEFNIKKTSRFVDRQHRVTQQLDVMDNKDQKVGEVSSVVNFGAGDLLEIYFTKSMKKEFFRFTEQNFPLVNIKEKKIIQIKDKKKTYRKKKFFKRSK